MRWIHAVASTLLLWPAVGCSTSLMGRSQFLIVSPASAVQQSRGTYQQAVESLHDENGISQERLLESQVRHVIGRVLTAAVRDFPKSTSWDWSLVIVGLQTP